MRCIFLGRAARLLLVSTVCATALVWAATGVGAQEPAQPQAQQTPAPAPAPAATPAATAPLYSEFRGVKIGTSRDEARKLLGRPQEQDKQQDFFQLSETERARVYYDDKGVATAVIVTYVGKSAGAPTPKAILGTEPEPKQDGSVYHLVQYPEAGYWVAYSRTAGDEPLTIITMQRMDSKR